MLKKLLNNIKVGGLAGLGGILWRMGGSSNYSKAWRRIGVAVILTIQSLLLTYNIKSLTTLLSFFTIGKGYGLPWRGDAGSSFAKVT